MTVPTEVSETYYTGNGATTAFPTGFVFLDNDEVVVKVTPSGGVETIKTEGTHYTLTGAGDPIGGTVTFLVAPANLDTIAIQRDVPFTQPIDLATQGNFSPQTHEEMFDESVFRDQELDRRVSALESAGAVGSVVAGDGLSFSSTTLHVGAGNGITVGADTVSADFGATGDLAVVIAAGSAAMGASTKVARAGHQHLANCAAPAAGSVAIGNAAGAGSAATFSRSDHVHPVTAPAAPADVTKAAASAGVATTFARADHKHDITVGVPNSLTDSTNAEGGASTLARSDHYHAHGSRGGDTLHAVATTAVAGFMSAADKLKLDNLATETVATAAVRTTDATPTVLYQWTPDDDSSETFHVSITGKRYATNEAGGYGIAGTVKRYDTVTAQVGATTALWTHEDTAGWAVAITIASPTVQIFVTGAAASAIEWTLVIRRVKAIDVA